MNRLTPVWTRVHPRLVAALALPIIGAALAAAVERPAVAAAFAALFYAAAIAGLMLDTFVAILASIGIAALAVVMKRFFGAWTTESFVVSVAELLLLVATAAAFGVAASALRRVNRVATERSPEDAAFGSLGLLGAELGELRLTAEVERAAKYNRPLSLLGVTTEELPESGLAAEHREAIHRTVARLIDSMLRVTDVAFASGPDRVVLVLPETRLQDAWLLMARISDAVNEATFVAGPPRERKPFSDYARVHLAAATYPQHGASARALLDATFRQGAPTAASAAEAR